jgi:hypothetical protein
MTLGLGWLPTRTAASAMCGAWPEPAAGGLLSLSRAAQAAGVQGREEGH